jgi:thermostable 8-oxoguanine DNA glycosylase
MKGNNMQTAAVFLNATTIRVDLPSPLTELLPGVNWGAIEAFPTPAYWAYQVFAKRVLGQTINYKLGGTLREEVGACLLGGHGIPAAVGLAAYEHLRALGAFGSFAPAEATVYEWLSQPLQLGERQVRYRFAKQKARYLSAALQRLEQENPPIHTGRALRDWLLDIPGIGYKTASWIARNWLRADDVAILDIHILRAGQFAGFFPLDLKVERHYLELEDLFLEFSKKLGVKASELDAVIWLEMMSSPNTIRAMTRPEQSLSAHIATSRRARASANKRHADADQTALFV